MTSANPALPKGELTRQRILDAAEVVFAELGYAAARLEDVASAVGIRRASIVYYFKNKQELYDAVEADIFSALQAQSQGRLTMGKTALERVQLTIDSWLDFMVSRPTAARLILRNSADLTPRSLNPMEFSETTLAQLEAVVRAGQASGEFGQADPVLLMDILGAGVLNYVCLARLLGSERRYDPADPKRLAQFREMLHQTMRALLLRPGG
jgi:TetR/AcrR family transcriptional regulator